MTDTSCIVTSFYQVAFNERLWPSFSMKHLWSACECHTVNHSILFLHLVSGLVYLALSFRSALTFTFESYLFGLLARPAALVMFSHILVKWKQKDMCREANERLFCWKDLNKL